jgi:anti-sigma regulatory factor (Ser/Thr protein kinase)
VHSVADSFSASYGAEPQAVARARTELTAYAARVGFNGARLADLRLAVSEAVTNAVLHGYRDAPGDVQVTGEFDHGALWIRVRDAGCGMRPRPETSTSRTGLGLGLGLIARVVDAMTLEQRRRGGTDLRMRFDLAAAPAAAAPARRRAAAAARA